MEEIGPPPDLSEFSCLEDELLERRLFMLGRGYRFCDIMACNCNSWHQGHAENRLSDLSQLLCDYDAKINGKTLLENFKSILEAAGYTDD